MNYCSNKRTVFYTHIKFPGLTHILRHHDTCYKLSSFDSAVGIVFKRESFHEAMKRVAECTLKMVGL